MRILLLILLSLNANLSDAQTLKLKERQANAITGSEFTKKIEDPFTTISDREGLIYNEVASGNIPNFYRNLTRLEDTITVSGTKHTIRYFCIPDFLAIGSDDDFFYCPMRPQLAQRIANLLKCSLPTRKISDDIYQHSLVKMSPEPIPPTPEMVTVPVFESHNAMVNHQRQQFLEQYPLGSLVAGSKKDVVISNKMYNDKGLLRVVIYGWHKPDGKPIQPLYNGHNTLHVDYSHGVRLVQNKVWVDGKRSNLKKVLQSESLNQLLSDEGPILHLNYPLSNAAAIR